jgi:hypothetical protein
MKLRDIRWWKKSCLYLLSGLKTTAGIDEKKRSKKAMSSDDQELW